MEEEILLNWIDDYLLGRISPEDKAKLEALVENDPETAALFNESREAFRVLQHAKNRELKEKLRQIDSRETGNPSFFRHWILLLTGVVLIIFSGWFWCSHHFSPAAIAGRNFEKYGKMENPMPETGDSGTIWKRAEQAFLQGNYEQAIIDYASLLQLENRKPGPEAEWNMLMAQLALKGPSPQWKLAMENLARNAPEPFQTKARRLLSLIDSAWYHLIFNRADTTFSALKPRLI